MPELYRVARTHALPADAEVVDHKGRPHARVRDGGRWALYPLTKSGRGYLKPSPVWCADMRDADGKRRRVRLSPVKAAAQAMLAKLLKEAEEGRAGLRTKLTGAGRLVLADLLAQYERHQLDRGCTAVHARKTSARCSAAFGGCGMFVLADLDPIPVERWLAARRATPRAAGGIGTATSNHVTVSLKAFGNFMVKTDRAVANPFRHLARLNADADIRRRRRALAADEFDWLLASTRAAGVFRGLTGADRAMLYLTAGMTGLRAAELGSLTAASFALDAATPAVTVEAAYSKRRRRDVVPLHASLVEALRPFLAGKPAGQSVWPGTWARNTESNELLRPDLAAARDTWVAAAADPADRARREASDFLAYQNSKGEFADFHSLRHRFVTELVKAGVMPKDAKELARHSTITLTMDRYAHATLEGTAAALGKLSAPGATPRVAPGVANPAHECGRLTRHDEVSAERQGTGQAEKVLGKTANNDDCGRMTTGDEHVAPQAAPPAGGCRIIPAFRGRGVVLKTALEVVPGGAVAQVAQVVPATEAEGPGLRFAVWFQGCPLRCPGCCNPEFLPFKGGTPTPVADLVARLHAQHAATPNLEGVSLLGGEPFAHAAAGAMLAAAARQRGLSVMIYSGYTLEQLRDKRDADVDRLLALTDLLVDGPFVREQPDTARRWVGSTNQRLRFLTDRYAAADPCWRQPNTLEVRLSGGELSVNGFPALGAVGLWKGWKRKP